MQRRSLFTLAAASTLAGAGAERANGADNNGQQTGDINTALQAFLDLPGTKSYLIHAGANGSLGRFAHKPNLVLFTASAFKTFVLGQYLRDVDAGLLAEDEPLPIDNTVRDVGSLVLLSLEGTMPAFAVLESMISHSDNTATNAALLKTGPDRVRALIAQAGLQAIRIPDSTRIFASYIVGAPLGTDLGWPGITQALENPPGELRPLLNDAVTLAGNAHDFVSWYEQALAGAFFTKPETLTEFKRVQSVSAQIAQAVPPDTPAFAKGGEVISSVNGFNAKSFAGQIIAGSTPVTFCFLVNWTGTAEEFPAVEAAYFAAIRTILGVFTRILA